jgi:TrmH family RNA methyltransferase
MIIISVNNPRIKAAIRLRDRSGRDEQGRIIIDGVREIGLAIAAGVNVVEIYLASEFGRQAEHQSLALAAEKAGAEVIDAAPRVMEKLAFGHRIEGAVAIAERPNKELAGLKPPDDALIAVVEGAEKPGNIGAIVRTADAAGVAAVIVADGGTDLYNPNAIRASLGAIFTVPVCEATGEEAIAWLRERQYRLFAARVDAEVDYTAANFRGPVAIALGSEANGLSPQWQAADITAVRLPLLGRVDSLNLSATAAVLFYEALRQRRAGKKGNTSLL